MRYVPHTEDDVRAMLQRIGVADLDALFAEVPREVYHPDGLPWPPRLSEAELRRHLEEIAARNVPLSSRPSFLGAGAYHHYIPAVVDALAARGEFLTAYTPYQPEASQGTLQVIFEFQTMVAELAGLEVANASLYDGATALVEALFMLQGGPGAAGERRRVVLSTGIHPEYRQVVRTYYAHLPYEVVELPLDARGRTDLEALAAAAREAAVFAFQSPSFYGTIEDARAVCETARAAGAEVVQVFDPIGVAVLTSPGEAGAAAAVAEGQPLGIPVQFGGPHLGLLATRERYVRRMPGRLVGRTVDLEGRPGYVLTLQTREQHIRRERATSNICTNVGLMALRATIYLAALGRRGLETLATICLQRAHHAACRIAELPGFALRYPETPFFREVAVRCPVPAAEVNRHLEARGIIGGLDLGRFDPAEERTMLLCFTEMTTPADIERLLGALAEVRAS
ncbi:MAG: glycine dehydrogenase [Planctomycetota bacterium]|nr:MAG: glycine dehydrogenase [Planctomycetota bacterium]